MRNQMPFPHLGVESVESVSVHGRSRSQETFVPFRMVLTSEHLNIHEQYRALTLREQRSPGIPFVFKMDTAKTLEGIDAFERFGSIATNPKRCDLNL